MHILEVDNVPIKIVVSDGTVYEDTVLLISNCSIVVCIMGSREKWKRMERKGCLEGNFWRKGLKKQWT